MADVAELEALELGERAMAETSGMPEEQDSSILVPGPSAETGPPPGLGPGLPLPASERQRFEGFFGVNLSAIRIHTDGVAAREAARHGAAAFTWGQHVVFGSGRYAPWSPHGVRLLGHELAHALQQQGQSPVIQAEPERQTFKVEDATVYIWPDLGQIGVDLAGMPWINVRWTPRPGIVSDIRLTASTNPRRYRVEVEAPVALRVTVNRQAEDRFAELLLGETAFEHRYWARGRSVEVNEHLPYGINSSVQTNPFADHKIHPGRALVIRRWDPELGILEPPEPGVLGGQQPLRSFFWEFDNLDQLQAFVMAWPQFYWVEVSAEGRRPTAVALDENGMQALAREFRLNPDQPLTRFYIEGKPQERDRLYELFYPTDWWAADGAPGDHDECLVYRHGTKSFGRHALTHEEAMTQWWFLEQLTENQVRSQEVEGYPFVALYVRGRAGGRRTIDLDYILARDELFAAVVEKRLAKQRYGLFAGGFTRSWDEILTTNRLWERYLEPALDRDEVAVDYKLRELLDETSDLADAAGERIFEKARMLARLHAEWAIEGAIDGLRIYADEEGAGNLVLRFPGMTSQEQDDTLAFIGVEPSLRPLWKEVLGDATQAVRVWMGESVDFGMPVVSIAPQIAVSVEGITSRIGAQIRDLRAFLTAVRTAEVEPIDLEGDFGNEVRSRVYAELGFNLHPAAFPHEADAAWRAQHRGARGVGVFSVYGSEQGYLFARAAADRAANQRLKRYLLIAVLVVASVVLVLVANAAGAALAGLLFEAGTAGFIITEVVTAAAIVTLVGPGMQTLIVTGGGASVEDYAQAYQDLGTQFVVNLATFGFFKALGTATRAFVVTRAGGAQAFAASRGWQAADAALRIGTSGAAFFGIGILAHAIETGDVPTGRAMEELVFETALSIILLEIGAYASRGPMQRIGRWARQQRLGAFADRMDIMQRQANTLNREIAEFAVRPQGEARRGLELAAQQRQLLVEQKQLLAEMQRSFRTRTTGERFAEALEPVLQETTARIEALDGVVLFAEAEVRLASSAAEQPEYLYRRDAVEKIRDYYTKRGGVVEALGNGVLKVTYQGGELVFRPSAKLDPALRPDGTRRADVLEAWRTSVAGRRLEVLRRAHELAQTTKELKEIAAAEPTTMNDARLRAFERTLDRAETHLGKIATKQGPPILDTKQQSGESVETWRQRLVHIKAHVMRQAELLGLSDHSSIQWARRLPTGRQNLKAPTVKNHAEAIEAARQVVEAAHTARHQAATTGQTLRPAPTITALRASVQARQADLRRRATIYGASQRRYIKQALRSIGSTQEVAILRRFETRLEIAEAHLDTMARQALERGLAIHGQAAIEAARTGELTEMSDIQVGDALRALNNAGPLSPEAIRGGLYASMAPPEGSTARSGIALSKVVRYARSPEELTFVLESFTAMREAGISGSFQVLRDAVQSQKSWKGSVWQIEVARLVIGLENIRAFEVRVRTAAGGREVDIVLKDGTKVELKDWPKSEWRPEKVEEQFAVDLEAETSGGTDATGIRRLRWLFRHPPPASVATIRAVMQQALERFIAAKLRDRKITTDDARLLRQAFADHLRLVEVPGIDRTQVVRPVPRSHPPLPVPLRRKDDEEEEK